MDFESVVEIPKNRYRYKSRIFAVNSTLEYEAKFRKFPEVNFFINDKKKYWIMK